MRTRRIDLINRKFGEWTVIKFSHINDKDRSAYWKCLCSCGIEKSVKGTTLINNRTKSCGHMVWNKKEIAWKVDENNCWICTSHKTDAYGYPACKRNNKLIKIHRLFYEKHCGKIPINMQVCHKCDNPTCINPEHLFLGTHLDNMRDMDAKGRRTVGEMSPHSKLTEKDVKQIRYVLLNTSRKKIAEKFNISINYVSVLRKGLKWKHLKEQ